MSKNSVQNQATNLTGEIVYAATFTAGRFL